MSILHKIAGHRYAFLILLLLLSGLYIWFQPGDIAAGDAAYKVRQVRDLARYDQVEAYYAGRNVDPQLEYFPGEYPWVYINAGEAFYIFPYQLSFLYYIPYALGGVQSLYLLTFLASLFTLYLMWRFARIELCWSMLQANGLVLLMLLGGGLLAYGYDLSEHAITACLSTWALLVGARKELTPVNAVICGAIPALAFSLRPESLLIAPLLFGARILIYRKYSDWLWASVGAAVALIIFGLNLYSNKILFGHMLGLRGIEFELGQADDGTTRLARIWTYTFGREQGTLFLATPVFLFAFMWLFVRRHARDSTPVDILLFVALAYVLVIPLVVSNRPGPQFGERFLFNVYPALTIVTAAVVIAIPARRKLLKFATLAAVTLLSLWTAGHAFKAVLIRKQFLNYFESVQNEFEKLTAEADAVVILHRTLNVFYMNHSEDPPFFWLRAEQDPAALRAILSRHYATIAIVNVPAQLSDQVDVDAADFDCRSDSAVSNLQMLQLKICRL